MKLLICSTLLFLTISLTAQEESHSNSFVLGGFLQFNANNFRGATVNPNDPAESRSTSFNFSPYLGKELKGHTIIGIQMSYRNLISRNSSSLDPDTDRKNKRSIVSLGVFSRHALNSANQISLFVQPGITYSISRSSEGTVSNLNPQTKENTISLGTEMGLFYTINEKFRVLANFGRLSFAHSTVKFEESDSKTRNTAFAWSMGLSNLAVGLELRL